MTAYDRERQLQYVAKRAGKNRRDLNFDDYSEAFKDLDEPEPDEPCAVVKLGEWAAYKVAPTEEQQNGEQAFAAEWHQPQRELYVVASPDVADGPAGWEQIDSRFERHGADIVLTRVSRCAFRVRYRFDGAWRIIAGAWRRNDALLKALAKMA